MKKIFFKKIPRIEITIMTQCQRELRKHRVKAETFIQSEKLFCLGKAFSNAFYSSYQIHYSLFSVLTKIQFENLFIHFISFSP